jgi:hypothetical protein
LAESYAAANYNVAGDPGTIDNWLITPEFSTAANMIVSFYARGAADPNYFDLLSYGLSNGSTNLSDFAMVPEFVVDTNGWTRYSIMLSGKAGTTARLGIRYTGSSADANYIGIDSVVATVPEPTTPLVLGIGLVGLLAARRRKQH